jgi:hypothetical protein
MIADASLLLRRIHNPLPKFKAVSGQKREPVFRSELRQHKETERFFIHHR